MSRTDKVTWIAAAAVIFLLSLFGCFQLVPDNSDSLGWYIQLNINHPASSKAITVTEYDVTGLTVEVYDPNAALIQTIDWVPQDGSTSTRIPVTDQGEYEIVVTHSGEADGEVVEAEESATFNIKAMIITVIEITPGCIGTIDIQPGTEDGISPEDVYECALAVMTALWEAMAPLYQGSDEFPPGVTFDFSNFVEPDGEPPFGGIVIVTFTDYSPSGSDVIVNGDIAIDITFPLDLLGIFEEAITASLSVSCLAGETVDIDLTLSMFMEDAPYWPTLQWDGTITVDGQQADVDQVMSEWLAMVIEATTPTDGTLTVRLTGADDFDGAYFYYAVVPEGYDLSNPDHWIGVAPTSPTISGGMVECVTTEVGTDTPAVFTGGETYDVGGLIDIDWSGTPNSGDYVFGPEPVFVDGDTLLELPFPLNFSMVP